MPLYALTVQEQADYYILQKTTKIPIKYKNSIIAKSKTPTS